MDIGKDKTDKKNKNDRKNHLGGTKKKKIRKTIRRIKSKPSTLSGFLHTSVKYDEGRKDFPISDPGVQN